MANMYDKPVNLDFINTYVSPDFNMLMKSGAAMQGRADQAQAYEEQMQDKLLQVNALNKDKELRNTLTAEYEDAISKKLEEVGGSYSKMAPFIREQRKKLHRDLTRGQLGQIQSNYTNWAEWTKKNQERADEQKIDEGDWALAQEKVLKDYSGVGSADDLQGISLEQMVKSNDFHGDALKIGGMMKGNKTGKALVGVLKGQGINLPVGHYERLMRSKKQLTQQEIYNNVLFALKSDPKYKAQLDQHARLKEWELTNKEGWKGWVEEKGGLSTDEVEEMEKMGMNSNDVKDVESYVRGKQMDEFRHNSLRAAAAVAGDTFDYVEYDDQIIHYKDDAKIAGLANNAAREAGYILGESISLVTPKKEFKEKAEDYNNVKKNLPVKKQNIISDINSLNIFNSENTINPFSNAFSNLLKTISPWEAGPGLATTLEEFNVDFEKNRKQEELTLQEFSNQLSGNTEMSEYSDWKIANAESLTNVPENIIADYYYQNENKQPYEIDPKTNLPLTNKQALINNYASNKGITENEAMLAIENIEQGINNYKSELNSVKITDAKLSGIKDRIINTFTDKEWNTEYSSYVNKLNEYNKYIKENTSTGYSETSPISLEEFKTIIKTSNTKEDVTKAIDKSFNSIYEGITPSTEVKDYMQEGETGTETLKRVFGIGSAPSGKMYKAEASKPLYSLWEKLQDGIAETDNDVATHYGEISGAWEKGTPSAYLKAVFSPNEDIKNSEIRDESNTSIELKDLWPNVVDFSEDAVKIVTKFTPNTGKASYVTHLYEKENGKQIGEGRVLYLPWKDEEIDIEMNKLLSSNRTELRENAKAYFGFKDMNNIDVNDLTLMHPGNELPIFVEGQELGKIEKFAPNVSSPSGGFNIIGINSETGEEQTIYRVEKPLDVGAAVYDFKYAISPK